VSKTLWIVFGVLLVMLLCAAAFSIGILVGRVSGSGYGWIPGEMSWIGPGAPGTPFVPPRTDTENSGPLGRFLQRGWLPFWRIGPGMMGRGMMGGAWSAQTPAEPISLEEAEKAVDGYLSGLGNADLALKEIMVFDNHAYAEIYEQSTGIGAMEVLVDPLSKAVYPEYGPNMMWNLKYGMMSPSGMGHGMMGGWGRQGNRPQDIPAEMPISPEEALVIAQQFLDGNFPGLEVSDEADPFYGYYTIHTLKNGTTSGMLSVNGFSGEVFPHTWHGEFIEMSEEHGE